MGQDWLLDCEPRANQEYVYLKRLVDLRFIPYIEKCKSMPTSFSAPRLWTCLLGGRKAWWKHSQWMDLIFEDGVLGVSFDSMYIASCRGCTCFLGPGEAPRDCFRINSSIISSFEIAYWIFELTFLWTAIAFRALISSPNGTEWIGHSMQSTNRPS